MPLGADGVRRRRARRSSTASTSASTATRSATRSRSSTCASPRSAGGRRSAGRSPSAAARSTSARRRRGRGRVPAERRPRCRSRRRFYDRGQLPIDEPIAGPAVIFQRDTTTVVPPGWTRAGGSVREPDPDQRGARDERGETARRPGRRPAVIAGALDSIAVEMGHKLARMSYSSIIRESEDFGCVICDEQGAPAVRVVAVDAAPVGADPRLHPRDQPPLRRARRRVAPGRRGRSTTTPTTAPRTSPTSASASRSSIDGELVGFSATTAHHLDLGRAHARELRDRRRRRRLRRGPAVQRDQDRGGGAPQRVDLADPPRQLPRRRTSSSATWRRRSRPRKIGAERFLRPDRPLRPRDGRGARART